MMVYTITNDDERTYDCALTLATRFCTSFQLVVRNENAPSQEELTWTRDVDVLAKWRASSWPGTELIGADALLVRFRLDQVGLAFLRSHSRFSDWYSPGPEDLSLWRSDGTWLLGSISHEHDVFLQLTELEKSVIRSDFPLLDAQIQRDEPEARS